MTGSHEVTVSEAFGLHELMLQDSTMIDKLAVYVQEVENREIESIFHTCLRKFEQNYNELIGFAGGEVSYASAPGGTFTSGTTGHIGGQIGGQTASRQTVRPQPMGRLQDRSMLMDCLVACKQLAVSSVTVATECSSPALRRTLVDMSRHHLEMAYDLYKVAEQHGWYPELKAHENPGQWLRSTHLPIRGTVATNGWRGYEQTAYNTAQPYSTGAVRRTPNYPERVPAGAAAASYGATGQFVNSARPYGETTNASRDFGASGRRDDGRFGYSDPDGDFRTQ